MHVPFCSEFNSNFNVDSDFKSRVFLSSEVSIGSLCLIICSKKSEFISILYDLLSIKATSILLEGKQFSSNNNLIQAFQPNFIFLPKEISCDFDLGTIIHESDSYFIFQTKFESSKNLKSLGTVLLSTSGSTGSQKFVRISYENLYANALSISTYLNIKKTDVTITNLPLSYSFGLSVVNSHLLAGAKVVYTDYSVVQKEFWDLVKEQKVTSLFGVPYTFEILDKMRFFRMDLPHLRLIGQAGGRMNPTLQEKYIAFCAQNGIEYYTMYGQTEATARMSYVPPHMAKKKLGSIGIPIPGGRFELRDENNQLIEATDSVGELVYFGPNVSLGYATCRDDLMKEDDNQGVLYTGDLAKRDSDDYYYLVGRKNRFLKLFGNRVSLQDLEDKLQELGIESVCGGTDDKLIAYTTVADKMEFITTWLSDVTSIHRSAFEVKYIDRIPRNLSGKILYKELFGE
jgi:acyl-coenzyme A synthetase/AMP-(fatty) acid ligase